MLVFLALGNAKVLSFALGDAKVPNANDFASQWNIGLSDNEMGHCHFLKWTLYIGNPHLEPHITTISLYNVKLIV